MTGAPTVRIPGQATSEPAATTNSLDPHKQTEVDQNSSSTKNQRAPSYKRTAPSSNARPRPHRYAPAPASGTHASLNPRTDSSAARAKPKMPRLQPGHPVDGYPQPCRLRAESFIRGGDALLCSSRNTGSAATHRRITQGSRKVDPLLVECRQQGQQIVHIHSGRSLAHEGLLVQHALDQRLHLLLGDGPLRRAFPPPRSALSPLHRSERAHITRDELRGGQRPKRGRADGSHVTVPHHQSLSFSHATRAHVVRSIYCAVRGSCSGCSGVARDV